MTTLLIRRLLEAGVVLFIVTLFVFLLLRMLPGDPAAIMLGDNASPQAIASLRAELGLNDPLYVQYFNWLGGIVQGDLGNSLVLRRSVNDILAQKLPITLHIGLGAFLLSVVFGIPLGIIAAMKRGTPIDSLITVTVNMSMSVPIFWLAILGIYLFSVHLGWLPAQGYTSPFRDFGLSFRQSLMPIVMLSFITLATFTRQTRSEMLETVRQDYIRTARAKGLPEKTVILKHALRNSLLPIITLFGLAIASATGGSVFIERIFNIPGLGNLLVDSVFAKDYVVVQSVMLVLAFMVVVTNLLVDLAYMYIDPRIRQ